MGGITNPTEGFFKDGGWGWDGTQWRKLPMMFGYSAAWIERESTLTAAAGLNELVFTTVPAGEVWVLTAICMVDLQTDPSVVAFFIRNDGPDVNLFVVNSPGAGEWTYLTGWWVIPAGSTLIAYYNGCTLNDDLYADACGFKMKIAE